MKIFAFWDNSDQALIRDFHDHWKSSFPNFKIYTDEEVLSLLNNYFPKFVKYYKYINIPAAKSDIARLLILYDRGGVYIDCHCGYRRHEDVKEIMIKAAASNICLVDNGNRRIFRPPETIMISNSIIFSKPKKKIVYLLLIMALRNIRTQWNRQKSGEQLNYNIWKLTGPALYNSIIFGKLDHIFDNPDFRHMPNLKNWQFSETDLKDKYSGEISIIREEDLPIFRGFFSGYRAPGQHWSERQKIEPLFSEI